MSGTPVPDRIERVAVVGAGIMGFGIAVAFAVEGREVTLFDVDEETLRTSEDRVDSALSTFVDHGRLDADERGEVRSRVERTTSLEAAAADVDFVTEAVTEDLDVKRRVFAELDGYAPEAAILATNTSGLSITDIASATDRPERVVGTHYFNPPHVVPLVEVVRGERTADAVFERTYDLMDDLGKTPVRVEKDIPGFIGNRIQTAMTYEAFSLLERGVASAEDIDRAVKAGFGFRLPFLGIFEKGDHSGLDTHHAVEEYLLPDLDRGTEPNALSSELVERGDYGLKTGKGVYDWRDADPEAVSERRDRGLLDILDVYEADDMEDAPATRD